MGFGCVLSAMSGRRRDERARCALPFSLLLALLLRAWANEKRKERENQKLALVSTGKSPQNQLEFAWRREGFFQAFSFLSVLFLCFFLPFLSLSPSLPSLPFLLFFIFFLSFFLFYWKKQENLEFCIGHFLYLYFPCWVVAEKLGRLKRSWKYERRTDRSRCGRQSFTGRWQRGRRSSQKSTSKNCLSYQLLFLFPIIF